MNSSTSKAARLRVVQWATGTDGVVALRAIIEHPDMELVGVRVYSASKAGLDASALCGLPDAKPTGVRATTSLDDIIALRPDCVVYMPLLTTLDDIEALLRAGINVVTTRPDFFDPAGMDPDARSRIQAACEQGRSSVHSTGVSPGWATEAVPLLLTSLSRRVDCVTVDEFADLSPRGSAEMMFDQVGLGGTPGPMTPATSPLLEHGGQAFETTLRALAGALGVRVGAITIEGEAAAARADVRIAAGTVRKGTTAAIRLSVSALGEDERVRFRFCAYWYCTRDVDCSWASELRHSGWRIRVESDVPLDVTIALPGTPDEVAAYAGGLTAHRAVNSVPVVCAAPPGIRTIADLPQVITRVK